MTIQITDLDARNLSIVLDDGVIVTTYTVLKYSCSLFQDVNTIQLRWDNDSTGSKIYLAFQWSEVTSPVTSDADNLALWINRALASCSQVQEIATIVSGDYSIDYTDSVIVINSGTPVITLLPATSRKSIIITNFTNLTSSINAVGSDTIYWRDGSSNTYPINKSLSIQAYSNGIDAWYFIEI